MSEEFDPLKLENQLCFPLYACAREITKAYKPFLDPLHLTYTQYIVMMVLWEHKCISVRDLGSKLHLDSGTLTPMLKKMEQNGLLIRRRSEEDERIVMLDLTEKGIALHEEALKVPQQMAGCVPMTEEEAQQLYVLLYKLLESM
ncbi:MAG: MarR family transcriptional regulator [Eubacteriales bacterium]|nr:MarR family transcriptional regulator [Eubacteriales bacterium]